jgi:beta-N-acetylhexosaminidase
MKIYSMFKKFIVSAGFLIMSLTLCAQDSLDIKLGQMLMVGFNGTTIAENDPLLQEISQGLVGGIVLFEKNISATNSQIKLKRLTWRMQEEAAIPLFMAIDQEGGRVNRLKSKYGFPPSVSAEYLGQQPLDSTVFYAELTAATLAGLGFNVNFAPVVDLAINPDNPIIAGVDRSYSSDPVEVAKRAAIVVKVHRDFHVATSLKHFPGHGSSKDDTHLGIADVTETWQKSELDPYKYLIEENLVDAVMSSHIVHKGLDASGNPGTLSYPIVTELLRDSLQFNGVVFTDDMQMKAITKYYGLEKSIRMALEAGVDVVIFGNNVQGSQARTVATVIKIMRDLVQEGVISEERIDASYRRIMALKRQINNP